MDLLAGQERSPPPHNEFFIHTFLYFLQFFCNFVFLNDALCVLLLLFLIDVGVDEK